MAERHTNRTGRLEALAMVRRAAEIQGRSVSDFVVAAAQEAAQRRWPSRSPVPVAGGSGTIREAPHQAAGDERSFKEGLRRSSRSRQEQVNETFRIEPLSDDHDRSGFVSGSAVLDRYFQTRASQDMRRRITTCFVAVSRDTDEIAGYYTLSAKSVALDALSPQIVKKLPRYPVVPAALLGRQAVARSHQGLDSAAFSLRTA